MRSSCANISTTSTHSCTASQDLQLFSSHSERTLSSSMNKKSWKSFIRILTCKLWAQSPSPPWGLWWCGIHHSWQVQHNHKAVYTEHEAGLSLSRSAACDLQAQQEKQMYWTNEKDGHFLSPKMNYLFLWHVQQCTSLSSSLYCLGPIEKWGFKKKCHKISTK